MPTYHYAHPLDQPRNVKVRRTVKARRRGPRNHYKFLRKVVKMLTLLRIYVFVGMFFANKVTFLMLSGVGFTTGSVSVGDMALSWNTLLAIVVACYIASKVRR